jgi:hypothetical protein
MNAISSLPRRGLQRKLRKKLLNELDRKKKRFWRKAKRKLHIVSQKKLIRNLASEFDRKNKKFERNAKVKLHVVL